MKTLRERFEEKYIVAPLTGCWLWTAHVNRKRYGQIGHNKKVKLAHRVSFELHHRPISEGKIICHHCDTPSCVNPDHLFEGTDLSNSQDRNKKGRQARGESQGFSKLTDSNVREIRRLYSLRKENGLTQQAIGAMFGIKHPQVSRIVNHKEWKHIE